MTIYIYKQKVKKIADLQNNIHISFKKNNTHLPTK
jgi:hypothetical protein